jgi:hypothetical protein
MSDSIRAGAGAVKMESCLHPIDEKISPFPAREDQTMPTIDPRIDAYIAQSPEFARPILAHLREVIHAACPQVQETMKWSRPHFEYKGLLCGMSAFKAHCGFGFWKGALMFPDAGESEAAGHFGRITALADLPSKKVLAAYVKQAMQLNEGDATAPSWPIEASTA